MIILGIETSCDETAVSVIEAKGDLKSLQFKILGSAVNSQIEIHKPYGGVFPALAKREHLRNLPLVLEEALKKADIKDDLDKIDIIAVTVGPGLEPALWTGINFAEKLGKSWGKAVIPTNHMEGHIASVLFKTDESESKKEQTKSRIEFPAIALLISGGHTELVLLKSWVSKETIGETQDDAVGEAFDKVARMMNLPYPGGPEISKLAEKARLEDISLEKKFPRPMLHSKDLNFSFSGLKTAVLYYLKNINEVNIRSAQQRGQVSESDIFQNNIKNSNNPQKHSLDRTEYFSAEKSPPSHASRAPKEVVISEDIKLSVAREFEDAVIEILVSKTKVAIEKYSPKTLIIGGGVIANKALRENFIKLKENYPDMEILIPEKSLTTDNATMIAAAGFIEYLRDPRADRELKAQGNLNII
ncbi:MAG: tRNA (adenosine(37)-N6)-threonylcarbamoyltransferase complex transferase subunit TsaD [Candidatus Zambryskibacteria bacterium RIFCSPLOWO2_01_FULL_35_19]|uniref:tRNA N6-adenosine threonylcarbamoyltransferase n=1 Tax=Candidatus Zambryskibacteria bacterium RIFCSPLOWO2_01_FULL_35_19 TaxID=1802757 RepID=A0A1G2TYV3_9BACT|nr:MAG: tRNA (adenosine(37)-N6)-threonylcarbamoyltransferase complex transferase subunit TsaD [Candidatus Zambryskibacteria bacterium RIFCSPHIGHO2_01_FULL_35_32]OHB02481.1 MAG: tRNA (adenosine(37)-N6)-threonylcarbamoyltransferase complex transferase subunit TsaD [Candidatus Zambryskibacteria bacterium RIFCSPLOWO2_01_FULL_35_19]